MTRLQGAIAATRFGMGARPGEIKAASSDPRGWLKAQIRSDAAVISDQGLMSVKEVFEERQDAATSVPPAQRGKDGVASEAQQMARQQMLRDTREALFREIAARSQQAATTPDSFAERWSRFWANHFTVAARNAQLVGLVGPFEREAIRPYIFSSFSTLLGHASFHPGMLIYLDAARSIGPSTRVAERRDAGLNENLAREIMELHTLGVNGGYGQADVQTLAAIITGWTYERPRLRDLLNEQTATRDGAALFEFDEDAHEPGPKTLLNRTYAQNGVAQGEAALGDLARHASTARFIATKLCRHFIADAPPADRKSVV